MIKKETLWIILYWGLLFSFLLCCNILLPPVSDYIHMELIGWSAVKETYMSSNARFGQCLLCWFAGDMNTSAFDFLNATIGTFFLFLLFLLIEGRLPKSRIDYGEMSFIIIAILVATMFGSVFLWTAGATNYLWGYTMIILHWIPYRLFWANGDNGTCKWGFIPFFFISIFAGWSSEQVGIMSIIIHLVLLCYGLFSRKMRFPVWMLFGVIGFILGFLILFMAPGTKNRSEYLEYYLSVSQVLSLQPNILILRIFDTIKNASSTLMLDFFFLFLLSCKTKTYSRYFPIIIVALYVAIKLCLRLTPSNLSIMINANGRALLSIIIFLHAFIFLVKRQWRGTERGGEKLYRAIYLIYIIYFFSLLSTILIEGCIPSRTKTAQSILLLSIIIIIAKDSYPIFFSKFSHLICFVCIACVIAAFADYRTKQEKVFSLLEESNSRGIDKVIIPASLFESPYPNLGDWENPSSDCEYFVNEGYEKQFGIKMIVGE